MDILASVLTIKDLGSLIELLFFFLVISLSADNNMQLDKKVLQKPLPLAFFFCDSI